MVVQACRPGAGTGAGRFFATIEVHFISGYVVERVTVPQAPAPTGVCDADPEEPPSPGVIAIAGAARGKRVATVEGGVIAIAGAARGKRVTTVGDGVIAIAGGARVKRVAAGRPR